MLLQPTTVTYANFLFMVPLHNRVKTCMSVAIMSFFYTFVQYRTHFRVLDRHAIMFLFLLVKTSEDQKCIYTCIIILL